MRTATLMLVGAIGLAVSAASATAAPAIPAAPQTSNIIPVAGGCGWGFHRHHGYCVPHHRRYRPYAYYPRRYGYYPPYPYYGYGYEPWNRPSPTDHVANQLNAQQARDGFWRY